MKIGSVEYRLDQTCGGCPEAYDVYVDDEKVGYLRLRHGYFRAECYGTVVYSTDECRGDGVFEPHERDRFLEEAVRAIHKNMHKGDDPDELRRLCRQIIAENTTDIQDFVTVAQALLERL